ncbi:MAG: ATP-binding cassette domain-containing protein [Chloroflexi bacterium]|nr:ATP-binding cassette domain-containing protein [Chloroflexota bacterium]
MTVSSMGQPLLDVRDLKVHFPITSGLFRKVVGAVRAVDGVSFALEPGKTFGLAGESGCGKTTLARAILRLEEPTYGKVFFDGAEITSMSDAQLTAVRTGMQMVFQDPYSSLNPRLNVERIVSEPLRVHRVGTERERHERVAELLTTVGLPPDAAARHPHEFSGGQRQRIGIARALALRPKLIVADEPVSSLDVSIRAQILNLMRNLQDELGIAYVFIAHDLALVRNMSHKVGIMYLGHIVETASSDELFLHPAHPYTLALLAAVPGAETGGRARERARRFAPLEGDVPSPACPPSGCPFHPRCARATEECREAGVFPPRHELAPGHLVWCHHPLEME